MSFVLFALRKPRVIFSILIFILLSAFMAFRKMPIDIFPKFNLPVIYVAQPYGGLDPAQMEGFVTSYYEYHFLYISGIKEVESRSIQGVSLIKLTFHPGTDMSQALSETVAQVNRSQAFMPPGTVNPFVVRFDTGSVPVGQLVFSSKTRSLEEIQDLALFKIRPMFASLPGVSAPPPFGGNQRTIVVKVDSHKLKSYKLDLDDIVQVLSKNNLITPSGNLKIGDKTKFVQLSSTINEISELNDIAIKNNNGTSVFLRDLAEIEDSADISTGYALVNGKRSVYIPVTKRAEASTWSVVSKIKKSLPRFKEILPDDINVSYEFDQSVYVKNALTSLSLEACLGALLTSLVILFFLRSWRGALIVIITIPISLMISIFCLYASGQTINIMTLGGLALAIGLLVDETTVTIENIEHHRSQSRNIVEAVVSSAREIVWAKLLGIFCILAVFLPSIFMSGIPKALFLPLSLAVGFSMLASFLVSQTLVPILVTYLNEEKTNDSESNNSFTNLRDKFCTVLKKFFMVRKLILVVYCFAIISILTIAVNNIGIELFPKINSKQIRLRVRAESGTRIEETEKVTKKIVKLIETESGHINQTSIAFVGVQPPSYPINTIYLWTSGSHESVISIAFDTKIKNGIENFKERIRNKISSEFPNINISFEPADIVEQISSIGTQSEIELAIVGKNLNIVKKYAELLKSKLENISYLRDINFGQTLDYPVVRVDVDRKRASQFGIDLSDISKSFITATYSSRFSDRNYWLNKETGTSYQVQVQMPSNQMTKISDLAAIPIRGKSANGYNPSLAELANIKETQDWGEYVRLNNIRMITVTANSHNKDLKTVSNMVNKTISEIKLEPGVKIYSRGKIKLMQEAFQELRLGILLAVIIVFLLLSASFESFKLAWLIISTIPLVLVGVYFSLTITSTTLNIQSYMGSIMSIGIVVANAILFISFAEEFRKQNNTSVDSAVEGVRMRIRPILMTSISTILGLLPMAVGIGEGAEQTTALGRAVIGGLLFGTLGNLTILPILFSLVQSNSSRDSHSLDPTDPESHYFNKELLL